MHLEAADDIVSVSSRQFMFAVLLLVYLGISKP